MVNDMDIPMTDEQTLEAFKKLTQAFYEFGVTLQEIFNEAIQLVRKAMEKADKLTRERFSWRYTYVEKPKHLLLDKRSRIYRCRNAI